MSFQVRGKNSAPDAPDAQAGRRVGPVKLKRIKCRCDDPKNIEDLGDKHQTGYPGKGADILFDRPEQQEEKRDQEMEDGDGADKPFPSAGGPVQVPGDLMRLVP